MESRKVEQHFENLEVTGGGFGFQGNVEGDLHLHRKFSMALYP